MIKRNYFYSARFSLPDGGVGHTDGIAFRRSWFSAPLWDVIQDVRGDIVQQIEDASGLSVPESSIEFLHFARISK